MTQTLQIWSRPQSAQDTFIGKPPILIEVPALAGQWRSKTSWPRAPRRRRLRREVRMIAMALIFAIPMSWAFVSVWQFQSANPKSDAPVPSGPAVSSELAIGTVVPRVSISLEAGSASGGLEFHAPVAVPAGYILPDDATQEPAHAGS